MSQLATICRNKVQAELKAKIESLSRQRVFCHDVAEEECKEDCRDTLKYVATMIKSKWKRNFIAIILSLSHIKG